MSHPLSPLDVLVQALRDSLLRGHVVSLPTSPEELAFRTIGRDRIRVTDAPFGHFDRHDGILYLSEEESERPLQRDIAIMQDLVTWANLRLERPLSLTTPTKRAIALRLMRELCWDRVARHEAIAALARESGIDW